MTSIPPVMSTAPVAETPPIPLAIIGIGCLFPKADSPVAYWANIKNGVDCITEVPPTHWNPEEYFDPDPKTPDMTYARRGGFLNPVPLNPLEFGIAPRDLEATDTAQLLGLVAAKMALQDAGLLRDSAATLDAEGGSSIDPNRISVILGVTGTLELVIPLGARLGHPRWKQAMREAGIPEEIAADAVARIADSYVPWQENSFPGLLGNVVAGRIANKLNLGGTNCVVDAACASSLSAVHLAALELATGRCDVAVTGGVDTFNDIFMYMCFSKTPALSPTGNARPFDAAGDGTILGEGLGIVILKRLADAERDGDRIYAVVKGIGSSSDGKGNAIYAPSAAGQKKALRNAYRLAGVTPDTIELVEAHGTGTRVGDTVEITALTEIYAEIKATRKARPWCAIGSVKSQIGHTKAAAGAASLIKAALALYHKVLPPTIKVTEPLELLRSADSPFYVNTQSRPWLPRSDHPRRAALSAFGFGGSNFHAVLEEYRPHRQVPGWDGTVELWAASARSPEELRAAIAPLFQADWPGFCRLAAESRRQFDGQQPCRLVLVISQEAFDLPELAATVKSRLENTGTEAEWQIGDRVFFGRGSPAGSLAFLFPGQGSQYPGMLRDLAVVFPEFLETLTLADRIVAEFSPDEPDVIRLSDRIYPAAAWTSDSRSQQVQMLQATETAQPALGAVCFAAYRLLRERFGIEPALLGGHSYGELPALAAAGRLTPEELIRLSRLRGKLMADQRGIEDSGGMLAVFASLEEIEAVIRVEKLPLVIANKNAPEQTVLSGANRDLQQAESRFRDRGIRTMRLPVAAAFHSPLVAEAARPFRAALESVALPVGTATVFANTTAAAYPDDAAATRELLGYQLANPVAFADQIRAMAAAGARTFVEVGPGQVLARLAELNLVAAGIADSATLALDRSSGKRPGLLDLACVLARLAARGHPVRLSAWEADWHQRFPYQPKPGYTVPISGANLVAARPKRPPRPPLVVTSPKHSDPPSVPSGTASMSEPRPVPASDPAVLLPAIKMTQETLAALQRMQEQTAQLHRQFLESQEQAQRTLYALVQQQQTLLFAGARHLSEASPVADTQPCSPPDAAPSVANPASEPWKLAKSLGDGGALNKQAEPAITATLPKSARVQAATDSASADAAAVASIGSSSPASSVSPSPSVGVEMTSAAPPTVNPIPTMPADRNGSNPSVSNIERILLEVVGEKTGYPVEMLDLKMTLDSDLGIDSIKRVEILSALQEKLPQAPVVKPEHLGKLHTLADVANFLASSSSPVQASEKGSEVASEQITFDMPLPSVADSLTISLGSLHPSTPAKLPEIEKILLEVVAEKTGYPGDMLDLGMALDADLGIDSIKRVEILSALQERLPEAPQVKPEHLGTLHTLHDVAVFLASGLKEPPSTSKLRQHRLPEPPAASEVKLDQSPPANRIGNDTHQFPALNTVNSRDIESLGSRSTAASTGTPSLPNANDSVSVTPLQSGNTSERIERSVLQIIDLEPPTNRPQLPIIGGGVLWLVADPDPFSEAISRELQQRGLVPIRKDWSEVVEASADSEPVGLLLVAPGKSLGGSSLLRLGFQWLKAAMPWLRQASRKSGTPLLASISRLDGCFGLGDLQPGTDPCQGGLAGLVKTARQEWPDIACKALDLAPDYPVKQPTEAAAAVVEELLCAGPMEVGLSQSWRCRLELARSVGRPTDRPSVFRADDLILVTGGGRGVTAEVAVALAKACRPMLILTGRTPVPTGPEPDWAKPHLDEASLKKAIAQHLGQLATPKTVGEEYARLSAQREIRQTLARIEATGARAVYLSADLSSPQSTRELLQQIQVNYGALTGLIHGAGVLADRRIEDLTLDQFEHVYATKVSGLQHLLELLSAQELRGIMLFSSTTARFGRIGQMAYAVANEVLNKIAQVESRKRPGTRVVAVNWGPWEGGMVTPALRKVFEAEGVGLIPLEDGGRFAVNELVVGAKAVEVIALGTLTRSQKATPGSTNRPFSGPTAMPPLSGLSNTSSQVPPPSSSTSSSTAMVVAFERAIEIATHPILKSHVLDGRAVLPLALHLEWLAHAGLHGNPGLVFHGVNDLRITHGVMVEVGLPTTLRAFAGRAVKQEKFFYIPVELRSKRRDGKEVIHSRAEVVLTAALPKPPEPRRLPDVQPYPHPVEEVYRYFLFHGPELHGIEKIDGVSETAFLGSAYPAPPPGEWFAQPLRSGWVADPLVVDTSFQMMILWTYTQHGCGSLPCFVGRYRQYRRAFPTGPVKIVIRVTRDNGSFARADIEYRDAEGLVIAQMQDYECVIDRQLDQAFRRNQLSSKART